jgi:hypothetical protein
MRLFFADLLMTVGAIVVLFGWVGAGAYAISVIAVGLGIALLGYVLDWRSRLRAVVAIGIGISWFTVYGTLALLVILVATLYVRLSQHARADSADA